MAGHDAVGIAVEPVDYKGGEIPNLSSSEFHHIIGAAFQAVGGEYLPTII